MRDEVLAQLTGPELKANKRKTCHKLAQKDSTLCLIVQGLEIMTGPCKDLTDVCLPAI